MLSIYSIHDADFGERVEKVAKLNSWTISQTLHVLAEFSISEDTKKTVNFDVGNVVINISTGQQFAISEIRESEGIAILIQYVSKHAVPDFKTFAVTLEELYKNYTLKRCQKEQGEVCSNAVRGLIFNSRVCDFCQEYREKSHTAESGIKLESVYANKIIEDRPQGLSLLLKDGRFLDLTNYKEFKSIVYGLVERGYATSFSDAVDRLLDEEGMVLLNERAKFIYLKENKSLSEEQKLKLFQFTVSLFAKGEKPVISNGKVDVLFDRLEQYMSYFAISS